MACKEIGQRWIQEKLELLVDLVKDSYTFLTGALTNAKTKSMMDYKWRDIESASNSLAKETPFLTEKIKKKWFDVKSRAKRDVALFKKETGWTGGVQTQIQNQRKFNSKFQTLSEAYALKVYQAPSYSMLVTTNEKIMQVIVRPM